MKNLFQEGHIFTNKQFMSTSPEMMEGFADILDGYKINFKININKNLFFNRNSYSTITGLRITFSIGKCRRNSNPCIYFCTIFF